LKNENYFHHLKQVLKLSVGKSFKLLLSIGRNPLKKKCSLLNSIYYKEGLEWMSNLVWLTRFVALKNYDHCDEFECKRKKERPTLETIRYFIRRIQTTEILSEDQEKCYTMILKKQLRKRGLFSTLNTISTVLF
jgi:hypothetical protein